MSLENAVDSAGAGHKSPDSAPSAILKFLAWSVHFYTALGVIIAGMIAVLLVRGGPESFRNCFILMVVATLVDATDGTLARRVNVKKVLPGFDGRKLDDIIDFLTYTFLPLLLVWRSGLLPESQQGWLFLPLVASIYGFCQVDAKTDDGYFLGFPSLWNVVALYLYLLQPPQPYTLIILITLGLMTFIPSRYLYPTMPGKFNAFSNLLSVVWTILLAVVLWQMPSNRLPGPDDPSRWWTYVSLFYPIFYMGSSWIITLRFWLKPR